MLAENPGKPFYLGTEFLTNATRREHTIIGKIKYSGIGKKDETVDDPYRLLADAIVLQAVEDYIFWYDKDYRKDDKKEVERFFRSQYFEFLTDIDGEAIIEYVAGFGEEGRRNIYSDKAVEGWQKRRTLSNDNILEKVED